MVLLHAENNPSSLDVHALCAMQHIALNTEVLHVSPALHMRNSCRMIFRKLMQC